MYIYIRTRNSKSEHYLLFIISNQTFPCCVIGIKGLCPGSSDTPTNGGEAPPSSSPSPCKDHAATNRGTLDPAD